MRLKINLATRRYLNLRAINLSLGVAFAVLGVLLLFKIQQIAYNAGELKRLQQVAAPTSPAEKTEVVGEAQYKALLSRIHFANDALDRKSVDWLYLLDRLEEVVPDGVALTQIQPDQKKQMVTIVGNARTFDNVRTFMENLERSPHFSEVYLLGHSETKVGLTQKGLTFNLSCKVARP